MTSFFIATIPTNVTSRLPVVIGVAGEDEGRRTSPISSRGGRKNGKQPPFGSPFGPFQSRIGQFVQRWSLRQSLRWYHQKQHSLVPAQGSPEACFARVPPGHRRVDQTDTGDERVRCWIVPHSKYGTKPPHNLSSIALLSSFFSSHPYLLFIVHCTGGLPFPILSLWRFVLFLIIP